MPTDIPSTVGMLMPGHPVGWSHQSFKWLGGALKPCHLPEIRGTLSKEVSIQLYSFRGGGGRYL